MELPTVIVREITYTEPAVRATLGKVLKPAKINTGYELNVPLFCAIGDKIEIDTARTSTAARQQLIRRSEKPDLRSGFLPVVRG